MSIAWGSLVLLILLLPGVLFFVGIYLPEQFTRESELRSPLGQLAGTLLVSFAVHGFLYCVLAGACGARIPCISVSGLLDVLGPESKSAAARATTEAMLRGFRWWIFSYVLGTAVCGATLGAAYGELVVTRRIRGFSRHPWIYDLTIDGLTYAYVMTSIQHEGRVLMYKGFLRAFALQQDGRFSYIVLTDVTRLYMQLDVEKPRTSALEHQLAIGAGSPQPMMGPIEKTRHRRRVRSYFVIEGEDVANVVFDRLAVDTAALEAEQFRSLVTETAKDLGITLTDEELRALGITISDVAPATLRSDINNETPGDRLT